MSSSPPGRQAGRRRALCCRQAAACVLGAYPLVRRRLGEAQLHSPPSRATSPSSLARFAVDRRTCRSTTPSTRGHRRRGAARPCPPSSSSSSSSICGRWQARSPRSRRILHRGAAGPARRRRQILRPQKLPDQATASIAFAVSFCFFSSISRSPPCSVAYFAMKTGAPRRREPWTRAPVKQTSKPPCLS